MRPSIPNFTKQKSSSSSSSSILTSFPLQSNINVSYCPPGGNGPPGQQGPVGPQGPRGITGLSGVSSGLLFYMNYADETTTVNPSYYALNNNLFTSSTNSFLYPNVPSVFTSVPLNLLNVNPAENEYQFATLPGALSSNSIIPNGTWRMGLFAQTIAPNNMIELKKCLVKDLI